MRQVVLDTETTGLEVSQGHRIIEIGCIEIIHRRVTDQTFHHFLNPDRDIDEGALAVHGISQEFLSDKPNFSNIADDLIQFIEGAELIIHNASFDIGFINKELSLANHEVKDIYDFCTVYDSLEHARKMHPGQKNSLDALCKRYEIDNSHRELHGALLDAQILADVYLAMSGGQTVLSLGADFSQSDQNKFASNPGKNDRPKLNVIYANNDELSAHEAFLNKIEQESDSGCVWLKDKSE